MTEECFVPPDKIKNYLLNFESESGGPKAKFFTQAGFSLVNIPVFIEALKEHYLNRTHCSEYDSKLAVRYCYTATGGGTAKAEGWDHFGLGNF